MDTPDENKTVTTRPLFASKMALAAVENTQTKAEAEAAQADEGNVDAAGSTEPTDDTTHSAEATEAVDEAVTTDVLAQAEAPATEADNTVDENEVHVEGEDDDVVVETDSTTVENLPAEETAVAETEEVEADTATEAEQPVVGEVEAAAKDHAEALAETEAALAGAAPVEAEVEQEAETDTSAEETVKVEPEAPATEDTKSVEELQSERDKLDAEIKAKIDAQKASVIAQIKTVAETYSITADELVEAMGGLKSKRKGVPAKPKYRDPATGAIWSGRGKEPAWIKGQDRTKFEI